MTLRAMAQALVRLTSLVATACTLCPDLEKFMGSIKAECLDRMVFFGESTLR
jgi:hypothetical protein